MHTLAVFVLVKDKFLGEVILILVTEKDKEVVQ